MLGRAWIFVFMFIIILEMYGTGGDVAVGENVLSRTAPLTVVRDLPLRVMFNNSTRLDCNIDGSPKPHYQWYQTANQILEPLSIVEKLNFSKVVNGDRYTLELDDRASEKPILNRVYFCFAQNSMGIIHSNKIMVGKVSHSKDITIKYTTLQVYEGEKFVIKCSPEIDLFRSSLKFKIWEVHLLNEKMNLTKTNGRYSVITSTKDPQLHIRNVTKQDFDSTSVRCLFQKNVGNKPELINSPFAKVERFSYPPTYRTISRCSGETINVLVGSNVELPWCSEPTTLLVKWFKIQKSVFQNSVPIDMSLSKFQMISERYGNLRINNIQRKDSAKYKAVTMGKGQTFKSIYTVNVYEPIRVTLKPKLLRVVANSNASFECASNTQSEFYWMHNGKRLVSYYNRNTMMVTTPSSSRLTVKHTRLSDTGVFQCIATVYNEINGRSEYRQVDASLMIDKLPPVLVRQSPRVERNSKISQLQMSKLNNRKTIQCVFASNPKSNIVWYLNGHKIPIDRYLTSSLSSDSFSIYNIIVSNEINLDGLYFKKELQKYAGEYKAVATNRHGSASCTFFVLMEGELKVHLPKTHMAIMGENYLLSCYFSSITVPEFTWERSKNNITWESMPISLRTVLQEHNYNLLIKKIMKQEDQGIYRCTANRKSEKATDFTYLKVANPPYLVDIPDKLEDIEKLKIFMCRVSNDADRPWFAWWTFRSYKDNITYVLKTNSYPKKFENFFITYDRSGVELGPVAESLNPKAHDIPPFLNNHPNEEANIRVEKRSYGDYQVGIFTCHVKNHIGSDQEVIRDNILHLEFDKLPTSAVDVILGDSVVLDCTAKEGGLNPSVRWRIHINGKYIDINDLKPKYDNRIFQFDNGTLVMRNVKETDPSKLLCFLIPSRTEFEAKSRVAYIDIRVPAKITPMLRKIDKVAGTSFNLSCGVYGNTKNLVVKWYHRAAIIHQWTRLSEICIQSHENECLNQLELSSKFSTRYKAHNRTYHIVYLEITKATESTAGQYKCEASNEFNFQPDAVMSNIVIISEPGAVNIEPIDSMTTSKHLSIQWQPPLSDGNKPIAGYLIRYAEVSGFDMPLNSSKWKQILVNSTVLSWTVTDLRPNRLYRITVAAQNEVGSSEIHSVDLRTHEAKPEQSVRKLKASSSKPHEIFVIWDQPDPEFQNGKIMHYQVCLQKIPTKDDKDFRTLSWPDEFIDSIPKAGVQCRRTEKATLTISNLPQFTDFGIRVIAFNSKGASPPDFTKVRTLEDLPQAPPHNLVCKSGPHTINLGWNPPPRQTLNGVLIGYVVQYYEPNRFGDETDLRKFDVQGTTKLEIDQLKPNTEYYVEVMALNRKGRGPPSPKSICTTKEAQPQEPEEVKAVRVNTTCIAVSWLHTRRPNGKLREYCVLGTVYQNRIRHVKKCQPPNFNHRYNHMIICDPSGDFQNVKVYARNKYDGIARDAPKIYQYNNIISISETVDVQEKDSVLLPCETVPGVETELKWQRDNEEILNGKYPNIRVLPNNSLEIINIDKYEPKYTCRSNFDLIEYVLNIEDFPNGLPRSPDISDIRVTENSIFVSWKSRGTTDITAPISSFILMWENGYTGEKKTVNLKSKSRTFYLKNVTCASDFSVNLRAQNRIGQSDMSNKKRMRTLGMVPQIADTKYLLPQSNINSKSVTFNLKAFGPGENCSAVMFRVEISLPSQGPGRFNKLYMEKNISVYDLQKKCCYKIINLNPRTEYSYRVIASNPAGPTSVQGNFVTKATNGNSIKDRRRLENKPDGVLQPWVMILILAIIIIFVITLIIIAILYVMRNKVKSSQNKSDKINSRKFDQTKRLKQDSDNLSNDSTGEPSPYAVYQPETDQKNANMWPQPVPMAQSNIGSTPSYNYPDNLYNLVSYGYRNPPTDLRGAGDHRIVTGPVIRRANSADCLSSNASVSGIGDLESPVNIDQPYPGRTHRYSDEIFHDLQNPQFSTLKIRKNLEGETSNRNVMRDPNHSRYNKNPDYSSRVQRSDRDHYKMPPVATQHRPPYKAQISMPERQPAAHYQMPYGLQSRNRSESGNAALLNRSQAPLLDNSMQNSQYNSYHGNNFNQIARSSGYGSRKMSGNGQLDSNYYDARNHTRPSADIVAYSASRKPGPSTREPHPEVVAYGSRVPGPSANGSILYAHVPNSAAAIYGSKRKREDSRPIEESGAPLNPCESPDESIYTDRVVVV